MRKRNAGNQVECNQKCSIKTCVRCVSFEEIIHAKLLDVRGHPSRNDQAILIYDYKGFIWVVPFVIDEQGIFLKTLYPSRKYHKLYKKR